jgi:UDP-glucuronate decarboxylase
MILEITGSRSPLIHRPLPEDDPVRRCPDVSRANERLGWRPRVELHEGIERTVRDFTQRRVNPSLAAGEMNVRRRPALLG